jgi:hypothetical protein
VKDGTTTSPLPAGAVVVATVEGEKEVYKLNGQQLDGEAGKLLSAAVSLATGGPDDDEVWDEVEKEGRRELAAQR